MKPTTFLVTFAGLGLVNAIPTPASPQHPEVPEVPEVRKSLLFWDPLDAYTRCHPRHRKLWERLCDQALTTKGYDIGLINLGVSRARIGPKGERMSYIKVQGAPLTDMENWKKLLVWQDGSISDGWPEKPSKAWSQLKRLSSQPPSREGQKAILSWEPAEAYELQPQRRQYWERLCDEALIREGCTVGLIHRGIVNSIKPNGEKTSYVNVEGAPLNNMEDTKKMRVFQDGTSTNGWSSRGQKAMADAKRPKKSIQPLMNQTAILSWDPPNTYGKYSRKRIFWEQRCHEALARERCRAGIVHQGETKLIKPSGETTHYIRVEGLPYVGTECKDMRVFQDGSCEYGWSDRDWHLLKKAKQPRGDQRKPGKRPMLELSTSTQTSHGSSTPPAKRQRGP